LRMVLENLTWKEESGRFPRGGESRDRVDVLYRKKVRVITAREFHYIVLPLIEVW